MQQKQKIVVGAVVAVLVIMVIVAIVLMVVLRRGPVNPVNPVDPVVPTCTTFIEPVINLKDTLPCEDVSTGGNAGGAYNLFTINTSLPYIVGTGLTPPEYVCGQYCSNGAPGKGEVCTPVEGSDVGAYERCMGQLTSKNCIGPIPLAQLDGNYYYAYRPWNSTNCPDVK